MEIVINGTYGGFSIPDELLNQQLYKELEPDSIYPDRVHPLLIDWVKAHPGGELKVVTIPPEATDYDILEYDGLETVVYVVDGQLNYI